MFRSRTLVSLTIIAAAFAAAACREAASGGGEPTPESAAPAEARTVGTAVGNEAPDFELPTSSGGTFRLSEHRGKRAVVLTFFRGTW